MQKKIGICTMYHGNRNYGANLQAYALCRVIGTLGYRAEQIAYTDFPKYRVLLAAIKQAVLRRRNGQPVSETQKLLAVRHQAIARFRDAIPHSALYYADTIGKAAKRYDGFVTGSDQVWNPDWMNRHLSLRFTDGTKPTVAYAASVGKTALTAGDREKLTDALAHTDAISVREKEYIPTLRALTDKPIEYVLDPTLLLTAEEWDTVCSPRIIEGEYMFCYFLRGDPNLREVATRYAASRGITLVTLPHLGGAYRAVDDGFGDKPLYDVSPNDFISLIKHASFVLTDSFHGTVFSHLYGRKFAVTDGNKNGETDCRLLSLTELFGTRERYIGHAEDITAQTVTALAEKPLVLSAERYEQMRQKSLTFLKEVLNG